MEFIELPLCGDRTATELTPESASAGWGGQSGRESPGGWNARERATLGNWCGTGSDVHDHTAERPDRTRGGGRRQSGFHHVHTPGETEKLEA